jgi:hypothetical protein
LRRTSWITGTTLPVDGGATAGKRVEAEEADAALAA